jgi:hypothetical protein
MSWVKALAYIVTLAGIGVLLDGTLTDLGFVLLIEGGVLGTLIEEDRRQDSRSRNQSV